MKRRFPILQERLRHTDPESWAVSAVTYGESLFGFESMPSFHPARVRGLKFLATVQVLEWPARACAPYAQIRHNLRRQPIGDRDIMIAAHAIAIDATLVTNNIKHFSRIGDPLRLENWLDAANPTH
jgi:tRNA(fMet)-specific endonuclease VapC